MKLLEKKIAQAIADEVNKSGFHAFVFEHEDTYIQTLKDSAVKELEPMIKELVDALLRARQRLKYMEEKYNFESDPTFRVIDKALEKYKQQLGDE